MHSSNVNESPIQATSAFGEQKTESKTPKVVASATYNLIPANFRQFTDLGGSISAITNEFKCSTGTTQFAYAALQSFRSLNIQYGSGAGVRFGARFPDTTANTWQGVGLAGIGDEISFGRNADGDFGAWHRHGGFAEVRTLQVTGAAGGAENATVTINGTDYTIALTATTVQTNAHEIATYLQANGSGFDAFQNNDTVTISFTSDGAKTGDFIFSSATATATFAQVTAGVTKTSDFTALADFNGKVPAGFDPTKGNQYQITYSSGYGNINYYIFDFADGQWRKVHTVLWQNNNTTVNLNQPSMRAIIYCYSVGATTDTSVYCAFISAFISGSGEITRNPRFYSITKSIGTTETVLFQIRNKKVYNGIQNQAEILPEVLSIASDAGKNVTIRVYTGNTTIGGVPNFQNVGTNLIAEIDVAGTTISGGRKVAGTTVASGQNNDLNLEALRVVIPPTLRMVVTAQRASGTAADVTASLTWIEDL